MKKQKVRPSFVLINKYKVTLNSLRNQLNNCTTLEELMEVSASIVQLEAQLAAEYQKGYKQIENNKKQVKNKIDKLKRNLTQAENELQQIDSKLDIKINGHVKYIP